MATRGLNIQVEALNPKRGSLSLRAYEQAVTRGIERTLSQIEGLTKRTVSTWRKKPDFKREMLDYRGWLVLSVSTHNRVWNWIDEGTGLYGRKKRKYEIKPKGNYPLRFGTPYGAKTVPNKLVSRAGRRGNTTVYARHVLHPGIKSRLWSQKIEKSGAKSLHKNVQAELNKVRQV